MARDMRRGAGAAAVVALLLSGSARAQQGPDLGLALRGRLEWISAAQGTVPRDTVVNPQNAVLRIPEVLARTELRPDLRLERGPELQLVARPRLLLEGSRGRVGGAWQPLARDATATWLELYGAWRVDDRLTVAYGLQNFQWGPAELLSPSNRIFHETGFARDPLYVVRGKHLVRVNLSHGQSLSAVLLAEVQDDGGDPFVAGATFDPKAAEAALLALAGMAIGAAASLGITAVVNRSGIVYDSGIVSIPLAAKIAVRSGTYAVSALLLALLAAAAAIVPASRAAARPIPDALSHV